MSHAGIQYQLLGDDTGWLYTRSHIRGLDDNLELLESPRFTEWTYEINSQRNGVVRDVAYH